MVKLPLSGPFRGRVVTAIIVAALTACDGCGPTNQIAAKPQDLILGHWTWTGDFQGKRITITNEFRKDGVVHVVQDGIPVDMNYRFIGDDQIDYGIHGRSKIVAITKDKLDIMGNDGVRRTWIRP